MQVNHNRNVVAFQVSVLFTGIIQVAEQLVPTSIVRTNRHPGPRRGGTRTVEEGSDIRLVQPLILVESAWTWIGYAGRFFSQSPAYVVQDRRPFGLPLRNAGDCSI